jgi:queuosine precursor transporter
VGRGVIAFALFVSYVATVAAANWALTTFGVVVIAGLAIPAAVFFAGLAFTLRDLLQHYGGRTLAVLGIAAGAALSLALGSDWRIAAASAAAFGVSEAVDLLVYELAGGNLRVRAVLASNLAGLIVDSVLFLLVAFGSLAFLPGQLVGKLVMTLVALPVVWLIRRRWS